MGALDAFYSTWSNARETFGQGTPQDGTQFDASSTFQQAKSAVEAAGPGSNWRGPASEAYGAKNKQYAVVFGKLADLDKRMATEVTNAANVVTAGRQHLDEVKSWVTSMANSIPSGTSAADRDNKLLRIATTGISEVSTIVQRSTGEMNTIGGRVSGINGEFQALDSQLGNLKEGTDPNDVLGAETKDGEGELKPADMEGLVHDALSGDQDASAKVDKLLNGINEEQLGRNSADHPLDPVQAELVGQLQAQMKPMSMAELKAARERLGPHKDILINAMHIMSDPDVTYPRHDSDGPQIVTPGLITNDGVLPGDRGALPDGVQQFLNKTPISLEEGHPTTVALHNRQDLKLLTSMVADGDARFQQGSYLDAGLMEIGAQVLDKGAMYDNASIGPVNTVVQDIFSSAGRDRIIAHEMLTGHGDMVSAEKGQEFLKDVAHNRWTDDGLAARSLTDWIDDAAKGSDPVMDQKAGEAAFAIADFLGDNYDPLTKMQHWGPATLGGINPELVQGYAEALAPYQKAMIGDPSDPAPGFGMLDNQDRNYETARKIFALIDTDPTAGSEFNQQAYQAVVDYQQQTQNAIVPGQSANGEALGHAGRLLGVVNGGADLAQTDNSYQMRRSALDGALSELGGKLPIVGGIGKEYLLGALLGDSTFSRVENTHTFTEIDNMQRWSVAQDLFRDHAAPTPALIEYIDKETGELKRPEAVYAENPRKMESYYQALRDYSATHGWADALSSFGDEYDAGYGRR